jgi:hypothetical protein
VAVVEFIDRSHQTNISFLDQVEELQAAIGIFALIEGLVPRLRIAAFAARAVLT